ncbi:MAG: carboxypeptidase regulatory-like domain-containing protein, partial [Saprospiraceae bacterium]|nr:carboxypeptidase regulatory-like domain-containing protein [Saprospiraceae bacterium]
MKFFNLIIIFLFVFLSACHKDEIFYNEDVSTLFTAKIYEEINGSVIGYVFDEDNKPVSGATVETYSATTTTNDLGVFILKNIKMDKQGTYIRVKKAGYIIGSDRLYPDKSALHSYIKLLKDTQDKSFPSSLGGEIQMTGGGTITFEPNSIKQSNGKEYNGEVKLTARFIYPNSPLI